MKNLLVIHLRLLLVSSLLLSVLSQGIGQSKKVIVYRAIAADESHVIGSDGKVLFKLPATHTPVLEGCLEASPSRSTFYAFDFADGPMAVMSKENHYLIDQQGKKVASFGTKYTRICNPTEGFTKVAVATGDYKKPNRYSFLDRNGQPAFEGKEFSFAAQFREGHAVVKPWDETEPWQIINATGVKVYEFPADMSTFINSANEFSDGLSMISVKPGTYGGARKLQQHIYVDTTGKEVLNMEKVTGLYNGYAPVNFNNDLAYLTGGYEYTLFNKQGKVLAKKLSALSVDMSEHYVMLPLPERSMAVKHVYDHQWNEVKLPQRTNSLVEFIFLEDKYIGIYTLDTLTRAFGFELIDPKENKTVYKTSKVVMDVEDGFVLIGDPRENKLTEIEDFSNKVIFGVSPESKVFESFKEALLQTDKVHHIKLDDENAVNHLCQFSNLRTIELNRYTGKSIPVCIGYLPNFKEFRVYNSKTLESLPKSLPKAPLLEKLSVSDCPLVDNLEEVIEGCKGLKQVSLINMELDQAFVDRMKKERPTLTISSWVMVDGKE
jgi:hypothetical protein